MKHLRRKVRTNKSKRNMKKVFLFATLAMAAVFNLGYIAYGKYKAMSQADKLVFENIEALSGGENPVCPDHYDVPNHYIEVVSSTVNVECTTKGTVSVCETVFNGSYEKGKTYAFVVNTYNCSGIQQGACCKQSDVRTEVSK